MHLIIDSVGAGPPCRPPTEAVWRWRVTIRVGGVWRRPSAAHCAVGGPQAVHRQSIPAHPSLAVARWEYASYSSLESPGSMSSRFELRPVNLQMHNQWREAGKLGPEAPQRCKVAPTSTHVPLEYSITPDCSCQASTTAERPPRCVQRSVIAARYYASCSSCARGRPRSSTCSGLASITQAPAHTLLS